MLRRIPLPGGAQPMPSRGRQALWTLMLVDVMAVVWMMTAGDWLDRSSTLTAVVTLGGHSGVVAWLAGIAFVALAGLAPMTGGFAETNRVQTAVVAGAGVASVLALAGLLSIVGLVVGVVLLLSLLGKAFVR